MKHRWIAFLLLLTFLLPVVPVPGQSSLFGPWRRFRSETLGFQIPYVDDWRVTELKNCVVFAMQLNPDPYVRLAVGRIHAGPQDFEASVRTQLERAHESQLKMTACRFNGYPAYRVEGRLETGRILDYYVDRGRYRYWISFIADRPDLWDQYAKSFEIILNDFRFL